MSASEVNFFISKSLLLKYRYFLSCLLALSTWKDDVLLTFQQQQQAGGTSLPRTGRSLCGEERGKGAPSSWLTDPHLADPEGETLNGEADKPAVSHLYLRPVQCCSGSLAGPLGVSISMEPALGQLKGQPTGTQGSHRLALAETTAVIRGARHGFLRSAWEIGQVITKVWFSSAPIKWKWASEESIRSLRRLRQVLWGIQTTASMLMWAAGLRLCSLDKYRQNCPPPTLPAGLLLQTGVTGREAEAQTLEKMTAHQPQQALTA